MTEKMAVVCNSDTPASIMPTLIFSSSGLSLDYEVHIFICPAGARWMVKGELEKLGTPKGMPNPIKLFNDILELGGDIVFCELALENKDIKPEDLRDPQLEDHPHGSALLLGCAAGARSGAGPGGENAAHPGIYHLRWRRDCLIRVHEYIVPNKEE